MEGESLLEKQRKNRTWLYFILVTIYSLIFYLPAILLKGKGYEFPKILLIFAGGSAPFVIGLSLVHKTYSQEEQKDFWGRISRFKPIGLLWMTIIFLVNFIPTLIALISGVIINTQGTSFYGLKEYFSSFLGVIGTTGFTFIAVFIEEIGWRGYALDGLQKKMHPLASSLILGSYWVIWHFPLFFIKGTYQYNLGFGSKKFWLFCFSLLFQTFIISWIYNNTNRSTLSAMFFHFISNMFGSMFCFNTAIESIRVTIYGVIALTIIVYWTIYSSNSKEITVKEKQEELPEIKHH
jgi:membrane protease YdiL (CAAX protease family)